MIGIKIKMKIKITSKIHVKLETKMKVNTMMQVKIQMIIMLKIKRTNKATVKDKVMSCKYHDMEISAHPILAKAKNKDLAYTEQYQQDVKIEIKRNIHRKRNDTFGCTQL